jgi:hypothetical protein
VPPEERRVGDGVLERPAELGVGTTVEDRRVTKRDLLGGSDFRVHNERLGDADGACARWRREGEPKRDPMRPRGESSKRDAAGGPPLGKDDDVGRQPTVDVDREHRALRSST